MKKILKKGFHVVVVLALLVVSFPMSAFASSEDVVYSGGRILSVEEFEMLYVDEETEGIIPLPANLEMVENTVASSENAGISFNNVVYNSATRNLGFDITILSETDLIEAEVEGTLYASWKQNYGIDSIVGDMETSVDNLEVLHFELYNDIDDAKFFGLNSFSGRPTLLMYISINGILYLYEIDIPIDMEDIEIENIESNRTTEGTIDGFWFDGLVDPTYRLVTSENTITPFEYVRGPISYPVSAIWTIGGVDYEYRATPSVEYIFTNVTEANSTWEMDFRMSTSYAYIDGVKQSSLTGGLRITNVDLSTAAGPYTRILNYTPYFRVYNNSSTETQQLVGLITAIAGTNWATGAAATIISTLINTSASSMSQNNVTSGYSVLVPCSPSNTARGMKFRLPTPYFLKDSGDYITIQMNVAARNFGDNVSGTNISRTGAMKVEFDCYTSDVNNKTHFSCAQISQSYNWTL